MLNKWEEGNEFVWFSQNYCCKLEGDVKIIYEMNGGWMDPVHSFRRMGKWVVFLGGIKIWHTFFGTFLLNSTIKKKIEQRKLKLIMMSVVEYWQIKIILKIIINA